MSAQLEQLAKKNRRRMFEAHSVIDCAPVSVQAKEYAHLLCKMLGARGWVSVFASATKQARWLAEDFNRKGFEHRDGQRGKGTGKRRAHLTGQAILNRAHELHAAGLVRIVRRRVGSTLGFTLEIRPDGLLRDALRGAYRSWRACFDADEESRNAAAAAEKPNVLGEPVQVLPENGVRRAARVLVRSVVRAAKTGAAKAETVIAAALEADSEQDRGGAEAVARLRALGILV